MRQPPGWATTTIGEITSPKVDQGGPDSTKPEFLYIDIGCLDAATKSITQRQLVATKDAPSRARQRVRRDDVIVSMTRPNLNAVARVPSDFDGAIASTGFHVLRSAGVEPGFLHAIVRTPSFVSAMTEMVQGALYPAVRPDDVRAFPVSLPPLNEQRRIIAKLDATFEKTCSAKVRLERLPALLAKLKRSILAAAFRGDLTKHWRAAHPDVEPASVLLDRIRTERCRRWEDGLRAKGKHPKQATYEEPASVDVEGLPALPKGWAWTSIDSLIVDSLYGPRFGAEQYADHGIPTIRTTDLDFDGRIRLKAPPLIDEAHANLADWGLWDGDLLVTRTGATIGKAAVYSQEIGPALPSAYLIRFRPVLRESGRWLHLFLSSPRGQLQLGTGATATAQPNVNARTIGAFLLPLAPFEEQTRILTLVEDVLATTARVQSRAVMSSDRLDQLERAALAKAFRGELVPQDLTDEPASVLLDRIRATCTAETKRSRRSRRGRGQHQGNTRLAETNPMTASNGDAANGHHDDSLDLVVAIFQSERRLTATAITKATGLDTAAVKKALKSLVEAGQVRVEGTARSTAYEWTE